LSNYGVTRLKKSSCDLQINYVISYSFYLYLILYVCVVRSDVTKNLVKFWVFGVCQFGRDAPRSHDTTPAKKKQLEEWEQA